MQIDTYFNLLPYAGSYSLPTTGGSTSQSGSSSSFGPASLVSWGTGSSSTGIYSNMVVGFPSAQSGSSIWQFNLSRVLGTGDSSSGSLESARSEKEQKADEAQLNAAYDEIAAGKTTEARTRLNAMLAENKTNAAAVSALGSVAMAEGKYADAEQFFLRAHALNSTVGYDEGATAARILQGDDTSVLSRATSMVRSSGQRQSGIDLLVELTKRSPDFTAARVTLGDTLLNSGDGTNGLMQYSTAVSSASMGELGGLQSRIQDLVDETPQSSFLRQLIGKVQLRLGQYDEARQSLTQAASLAEDPTPYNRDLARAFIGLGKERLAKGDITGGMSNLDRAKELNPTGAEVKLALAEGYFARAIKRGEQRDYDAALEDYGKVAQMLGSAGNSTLRGRAADSAYALGLRLQRQRVAAGEPVDKEVLAFQAAYDLDPTDTTHKHKLAETRNALGDQYTADGLLEEAAYAYKRAYELYKSNTTYKQNTLNAFVAWGDDRAANLSYDDAIEAYREAYELNTFNVENKTKLAEVYNARGLDYKWFGKTKLALADFSEAMRLFPDNAAYRANYLSVGGEL